MKESDIITVTIKGEPSAIEGELKSFSMVTESIEVMPKEPFPLHKEYAPGDTTLTMTILIPRKVPA